MIASVDGRRRARAGRGYNMDLRSDPCDRWGAPPSCRSGSKSPSACANRH